MPLKQSDFNKAVREFFKQEVRDIEAAVFAANKTVAERLSATTKKEIKTNFKISSGSNFAKAVKVANLKSKGVLPPASFVRIGISFMEAFQEGKTILPRKGEFLIVLLEPGQKLGFKRITKNNPWQTVWNKIRERSFFVRRSDGILIMHRTGDGRVQPIYKMTRSVTVPKLINFYENAEKLADRLPEIVNRLLSNSPV